MNFNCASLVYQFLLKRRIVFAICAASDKKPLARASGFGLFVFSCLQSIVSTRKGEQSENYRY